MGHLRRFVNLIVDNHEAGIRSLRCVDLKRLQLFHPTTPLRTLPDNGDRSESAVPPPPVSDAGSQKNNNQAAGAASMIKSIRLPNPSFSLQACSAHGKANQWKVGCFPLAGRKVICTDQCGRNVLFDGDTRSVVIVPDLHTPKRWPISLFVPSDDGGEGSLFIMERDPVPVRSDIRWPSHDFEALAYHKGEITCQQLPPPPYVHEPTYTCSRISSYAVVGGSLICISVDGRGTYLLDTSTHAWSNVGSWMLPFRGKVEYAPELKLWFGLSADAHHLVAADLSTMDSQPQLVGRWKKELHPLEEWIECRDAQLVYLGSGKFCIARFFFYWEGENYHNFSALTGVEVVPHALDSNVDGSRGIGGNGEVQLEMIPHKTRYHMPAFNQTIIEKLF